MKIYVNQGDHIVVEIGGQRVEIICTGYLGGGGGYSGGGCGSGGTVSNTVTASGGGAGVYNQAERRGTNK